ncbi:MAG: DUF1015 domain-containing protein [Treponema sp.]|nr:DUF1015 domain-containing protein [Treponema sp.]
MKRYSTINQMDCRLKLNSLGVEIPEILLPKKIDLQKWSVIACDQYTQDRGYWEKVKAAASGASSTLDLIFPEVYLSDGDAAQRIADIHSTMKRYLMEGIFAEPKRGVIYIERDTPFQKKRRGLVAAIDLEQYDWKPEARPLIRSTEGTVEDRLPPRMDIRRGALLELPHVLLLIDDETNSLLPDLGERAKRKAPIYKTGLMMDSGSLSGWLVDDEDDFAFIAGKLEELKCRSENRYGCGQPFLFAVGDGNHSLAAAKGIREEYKKSHPADTEHPCRYALVEIENIYDPAIQFEPIHRLVFGMGFDEAVSLLSGLPDFSRRDVDNTDELARLSTQPSQGSRFGIISRGRYALIETSAAGIATACLQPLLDSTGRVIEYIHDNEELFRLASSAERPAAGILLPPVQKTGLFDTIARLGPLPRKSFSMGHSAEKRFYLECRRLSSEQ